VLGLTARPQSLTISPLVRPFQTAIPAALFIVFISVGASLAQQPALSLSTQEEIAAEFAAVPCKNSERVGAVKALFEKMHAPAVTVETFKNFENVVVKIAGKTQETIVIGAHYDLVEPGCGAVDNWTGVVAVAHLYRTIRQFAVDKTVLFVAFGKEEQGLLGSSAMAKAIEKNQLKQYCAVINIDSFGMATPFALAGSSSSKLMKLTESTAEEMKMPFAKVYIENADSDSTPFKNRGIPAVTLSGLSSQWQSVLHSKYDQPDKIIPLSVYLGYRLALSVWNRIERAPCDAYR
jgi:Zn-dependent M28 family amino/carboxypeptidase